ncbi:MAG: signal peptide peptidase SppA [Bacteroidales bacterium]|jgi:protease-4|nr:signal peptide peptidase SppA [Bacteroidales bacterium]
MKQFFKFMFASMAGFVLSGILLFVIFLIMIVSMLSSSSEKKIIVKENSILEIKLNREISERSSKNPFDNLDVTSMKSKKSLGLYDIVTAIKSAANDKKIKGIYLNISGIQAGISDIEEIRNAIIEFKKSGKFVISYSEGYTQGAYYLATAADQIYLNNEGAINLKGLGASVMFFKGTLSKLDVEAQIIRHGKFKSAIEPYTLDKMSAENREQTMTYVGSIWNDMVSKISKSRKISENRINEVADSLLLQFPQDALDMNFVDDLIYKDQLLDVFKEKVEAKSVDDINFISLEKYLSSDNSKTAKTKIKDKIAVIYAVGEITGGEGSDKSIGSEGTSKEIRKARLDENIKAIVLRVNSPGGSALASEVILRELMLAKEVKPVVVSMGSLAASGGYYISCHANYIYAQPNTLTGSIGVFGMIPNIEKLLNNKLGVTVDQVKTNQNSDYMSINRPMTEYEYSTILKSIERIYDTFITHVANGRGLTKEYVDSIGQGRVWSGIDAKNLKLVDELGGIDDAIAKAANLAEIEDYRLTFRPVQKDFVEQILEDMSQTQIEILKSEFGQLYEFYEVSQHLYKQKGIQARLPFVITIE